MKSQFISLLTLSLSASFFLVACENFRIGPAQPAGPEPAEASVAAELEVQATPDPFAGIEPTIDVSGCWREVGNAGLSVNGAEFHLRKVAPNAFVFPVPNPPVTKLVFNQKNGFMEVNFDPEKPFFPKDYIHSTGAVNAENTVLERRLAADPSRPRTYRRCDLTRDLPRATPAPPGSEDDPEATPTPVQTPLILAPDPEPSATPEPAAPAPQPTPEPTPTPTPLPTGIPTPTPVPRITPLVPPLASPTPEATPEATPEPTPEPTDTPAEAGSGSETGPETSSGSST